MPIKWAFLMLLLAAAVVGLAAYFVRRAGAKRKEGSE